MRGNLAFEFSRGEKVGEEASFLCVTYIGLLEVLAEVLICKKCTELDLRIKEI